MVTISSAGHAAVPARTLTRPRRVAALALLAVGLLALWLPGFVSLPPMDRDEPRFAQASKQMLESGDYVSIRNGDEARNKKPVGIYWLQAAAVSAGEALGVADARRQIWLYRLPSFLAAAATVGFTAWAALPFVSRRGAWLAGLLTASTLLLGVEARLATTDAAVAATVAAGMGALSRAWTGRRDGLALPLPVVVLFWAAMGVGVLVKGPITPMIPALAAIVLSLHARSAGWLRGLRPLPGLVLCLVVVAPWFMLILVRTHGAFLADSVGHDMLGKVASGQEMHGAPPGTYLAAFLLSGWPLAPFAVVAIPSVWRHRRDDAAGFLLAWLVPAWLVFEAVPTKLFHYVLPLYPALAILAILGIEQALRDGQRPSRRGLVVFGGLLALVPVVVGGAVPGLSGRVWTLTPALVVDAVAALGTSLALVAIAVRLLRDGAVSGAVVASVGAAMAVAGLVFGLLLTPEVAPQLALSGRLAVAAREGLGAACPDPTFATVGDREPSLMFLTDTRLLMTDAAGAARFMDEAPCRAAFVDSAESSVFERALRDGGGVRRIGDVAGLMINGGRPREIGVYIRE